MQHLFWQPPCRLPAWAAVLLLGTLIGPAGWAQATEQTAPAAATTARDPGDAAAAVPALVYRSALGGYCAWREQTPGDWRALNDEVTRIGGWRSYLREAHQAAPVSAATPGTPRPGAAPHLAPASAPHHGQTTAPVATDTALPMRSPTAAPTHTPPAPKANPHAHH